MFFVFVVVVVVFLRLPVTGFQLSRNSECFLFMANVTLPQKDFPFKKDRTRAFILVLTKSNTLNVFARVDKKAFWL